MKVGLKIKHKNFSKEHQLSLNESLSLGRSSSCGLIIDDERISSKHCRIELKWDRLEINDLDSKNGTYLNGIRIDSSEVFVGDEIRIGKTIIKVEEQEADTQAINALSFPGPMKERITHGLKADYTGMKHFHQPDDKKALLPKNITPGEALARAGEQKRKIQVSKYEIRGMNKKESTASTVIDIVTAFIALGIPLLVLNSFVPESAQESQRMNFLIILEVVAFVIYYVANFKLSKFTLGEKFSGIEKLYLKQ
jgi:pSer/pThr/pTyr-binding forkhead associated (FHA) protein